MLRYFIAGNIWLFLAFLCYVGRNIERGSPTMYSLFGLGHWYYPAEYTALLGFPLILSAICFLLYWHTRPPASFQFSIRTLLIAVALVAFVLGLMAAWR